MFEYGLAFFHFIPSFLATLMTVCLLPDLLNMGLCRYVMVECGSVWLNKYLGTVPRSSTGAGTKAPAVRSREIPFP